METPASLGIAIALLGACASEDERCTPGNSPATVVSTELRDHYLRLDLQHSGGCGHHEFAVWWTGIATPSIPPKVQFILQHYNHGDICEALVGSVVWVDLSPLHEFPGGDRVLVNLWLGEGGTGVGVDYTFAAPAAPPSDDVLAIETCGEPRR